MKEIGLRWILISLLGISALYAQPLTLSGTITDAKTGEALIAATVVAKSLGRGTYTNDYGYYSLTLPPEAVEDSFVVQFSYIGFDPIEMIILLDKSQVVDLELSGANTTLEAVEIVANSYAEQLRSTEMSVDRISMAEAKKLPALFGEVDIIKTLQLKPGVSSGSEGSSGIYVRGGGPDQNLVVLDGTTVYNPSHLFGFFSTFNSDAVKDVKLYKGGFPAQYGGRLSSVIDVKMNEGNRKKFSGSGGLGLIASRLTLEGPITKDKSSFLISGRRTYVDIFTRMINKASEDNPDYNQIPDYFFYDLNGKINYDLGENDQIFLSGYLGRDRFRFEDDDFNFNFYWGNSTGSVRWNHLFTPRLFLNTTLSFTDYQYEISNEFDIFAFSLSSQITDLTLTSDFTYVPDSDHTIRFGALATRHRFIVGRLNAGATDGSFDFNAGNTYYGNEYGAYVSDEWELSSRFRVNGGVRVSAFENEGTTYFGLEPRLALNYSITEWLSFKASYARMSQYLHLVANSGATLPTDVWYPSNDVVPPQRSHQVAGGFAISLGEDFLLSNEIYYKQLENQVDFRDAANLFVNDELDTEFVFGEGWGYGNELYLEKKRGRLTGWIGYTLAWAFRRFDGTWRTGEYEESDAINEGRVFSPVNDRRHDVTVVALYDLGKRLSISASWEYRTGNVTTLAVGRALILGPDITNPNIYPLYDERNSFRMPPYHKLDIGLVWRFSPKWGESDLTISAYNAYNRRNPYFIYYETIENENGVPIDFKAKQVALFPIIPSLTYNFKF